MDIHPESEIREKATVWKDRKVLVTGGAGFIGSNLVQTLVGLGSKVSVADNLTRGKLENLDTVSDQITFHRVDLTDAKACLAVAKDAEYMFHLASSVGGIQYISKENVDNLTPSCMINLNMLEAARVRDVNGFLFTSSACVYRPKGDALNRFKEEDAYPANPPTTYGWAKILGEVACKSYYKDYGLKSSVVRIFNAYGENENFDPKSSHVIPSLIRKALLYPQEKFVVYGDGKQERAFLYVNDCVRGLLLAMEEVKNGEAVNIGDDRLLSIAALAEKIVELVGRKIPVDYDLRGPRGVNKYCAETSKIHELGWKPATSLEVGLQNTLGWAIEKIRYVAA